MILRVEVKVKYLISFAVICLIGICTAFYLIHYRGINKVIYDNLIFSYDRLSVSNQLKDRLKKYNVTIRKPYDELFSREKPVRYEKYYFRLATQLNTEHAVDKARRLRDDYWKHYDPFNKGEEIKQFKTIVGYHEKIESKGKMIDIKKSRLNRFGDSVEELSFVGRFDVPFVVLRGRPRSEQKGILIALHGRRSDPLHVMGVKDEDDYARSFGAYWLKKGYSVYAPQVDSDVSFPLIRFNYTPVGADLAKIGDILQFIGNSRYKCDTKLPIVVAGISYGSMLAEFSGIIFEEIDAVISIGGNARGDFIDLITAGKIVVDPNAPVRFSYLPPTYEFLYNGLPLYKLIAPKPLVISIGTHDHGEDKFKMIFDTVDYYRSIGLGSCIKVNIFKGRHEADPEGEFLAFNDLEIRPVVKQTSSHSRKMHLGF